MKSFIIKFILIFCTILLILSTIISCIKTNIQLNGNLRNSKQMAQNKSMSLKVLVIEINPTLKTKNNIKASEFLGCKRS